MSNKIVIIGGVAGGATAAARARRLDENAEIILFERGEYISFANCGLPYYIGDVIRDRNVLFLVSPEGFRARYNIDIRIQCEVKEIIRDEKTILVLDHTTGKTYRESYDKLILSPGAEPIRPRIEGVDSGRIFTLRTIMDTDRIKDFLEEEKPKKAVVVGGGFIGIEMAENLSLKGVSVDVIEKLPQILPQMDPEMAGILGETLGHRNIDLILNDGVAGFAETENGLEVTTEKGRNIQCDMAVLSIGVKPETGLAQKAGLEVGKTGGIRVNLSLQTSDPDIFAVGDAIEILDLATGLPVRIPLAGPANKQGRIAADNAVGRKSIYKGTTGASIVKVFDMAVASVGSNEKRLIAENIPYEKSYTFSGSHSSYYPGADDMLVKLLFSPGTGKILGSQIVGSEGVDKRIDVLATAIYGNMTVFDLEHIDLAYAPPFASAKEVENIAGYVASNMLKHDTRVMHYDELSKMDPGSYEIIDLRTKPEIDELGIIPGARHIPVDSLRKAADTLDREKTYLLYCAIGQRGYVGYRILSQKGFSAVNLAGGYELWSIAGDR